MQLDWNSSWDVLRPNSSYAWPHSTIETTVPVSKSSRIERCIPSLCLDVRSKWMSGLMISFLIQRKAIGSALLHCVSWVMTLNVPDEKVSRRREELLIFDELSLRRYFSRAWAWSRDSNRQYGYPARREGRIYQDSFHTGYLCEHCWCWCHRM